jgi:acetylornithine aminotransferase
MAAALCVCETLINDRLLTQVQERGEQLRAGLRGIAHQYPQYFAEVRGWGLINGLVLQPEGELTALDIVQAAITTGLLVAPAGPQVVRLVPPLIVSANEVDQAIALLHQIMAR